MSPDKCFDDGSNLQALHDQVYGGPGPDVVASAAASLVGLAPWINSSAQRLRDAFSKTGTEWTGPAAEAATTSLTTASNWAENTSIEIHATGTHVQNYADSFTTMKPKIVPPQPVPSLNTWDVALGVLDPSNADHAQAVQNNANATEIALAAYSAHETHTNESVNSISPPPSAPQITNPTSNLAIIPTGWSTSPTRNLTSNPSDRTPTQPSGSRRNHPATPSAGDESPSATNPSIAGVPPGGFTMPSGSAISGNATVPSGWTPLPPRTSTGPLAIQPPPGNSSLPPPSPVVATPPLGIASNGSARPGPPPRTPGLPLSDLDTAPHGFGPLPAERALVQAPTTPTEGAFSRDFASPVNRPAGSNAQPIFPANGDGADNANTGERYRRPEQRRITAKDEDGKPIQLYHNLFAIDEDSENATPPVIGLEGLEQ